MSDLTKEEYDKVFNNTFVGRHKTTIELVFICGIFLALKLLGLDLLQSILIFIVSCVIFGLSLDFHARHSIKS